MNNILIPVFTDEDAKALPKVANYLRSVKPKSVVVIHNPSVGINSASATEAVDKKIADLEKAKSDAIAREDFAAADRFKRQVEDEKVGRGDVLRSGWKSVSEADRAKVYEQMNKPLLDAAETLGFRFAGITLLEDQPPENLFITLANFGRAWPTSLPHGKFSLIWPQDAPENASPVVQEAVSPDPKVNTAPVAQKVEKKAVEKTPESIPSDREGRIKHYRQRYMLMKKKAGEYGIEISGRDSGLVAAEIVDRELATV
jgi:hypothetical protein